MKRVIIICAGLGTALLVLVAIGLGVVAPKMADEMAQDRLARVAERTGWSFEYENLDTTGLAGVEISGLVGKTSDGQEFVRVDHVLASADLGEVLMGNKKLDSLEVRGVTVRVRIDKDGSIFPLNQLREADPRNGAAPDNTGLEDRFKKIPGMVLHDVHVEFEVEEGGPNFPIKKLTVSEGSVQPNSDRIRIEGKATLEATEMAGIELPRAITGSITIDTGLKPSEGELTFDTPLSISGVGPLPFLAFGFSGADVDEQGVVGIRDLQVSVRGSESDAQLFVSKRVGLSLEKIPRSLSELRVVHLHAEEPTLFLDFNAEGANALNDVWMALRAPIAKDIAASATRIAEVHAEKLTKTDLAEESELEAEIDNSPSPLARLEALVKRWAPDRITVSGARIVGNDQRVLALERFSSEFALENGGLEVTHHADDGKIVAKGGFDARGDGADLGKGRLDIEANYGKKSVTGNAELDALDLSWVGQVLGERFRNLVTGGTLRTKVSLATTGPTAFRMDGFVSLEDATITTPRIADDPIEGVTGSYTFAAKFDAAATMPEAKLLEVPVYKTPKVEQGAPPPVPWPNPIGSLVFEKGEANFQGAKATIRPAFYGFNAPGRLPARFDLQVIIPKTDVMTLFDAVPKAVQGPTAGTRMNGTFSWDFAVEVPLYRASDMKWDTKPIVEGFELLDIPSAVDVKKLMKGMQITITDTIEVEDDFERTIRLPAAKPVPIQWLLENSGLTLEEIDERRRTRGWPEVPTARMSGLAQSTLDSPQFWFTPVATNQAPKRPWAEGAPITGVTQDSPLGAYVFVPIEFISPFMPRAVMTTEDNGFFKHSGFNTHALRASIERNIKASGFKRGASTIAMQMIKEAFLHRRKVISRKIQEAFLVFLMETAIDVPKSRIMEIYLNIIEFGPGIYGIHDAAVHYFGKRPDELTIGECAWFVSIIPGPKKYHSYYDRGAISEAWFRRMKRYIQVMYNRERITEEQLNEALLAPPEFYKPEKGEPLLRPKARETFNMFEDIFFPTEPELIPPPNPAPAPAIPPTPAPTPTPAPVP